MYAEQFQKSLKAVEEAREANIAYEPARMTAKEKEDLLAAYHPDYKQDEFEILQIGPNKGDKVPKELAAMLQEEMYDELDGPVGRVAALDVPMPYNIALEKYVIPDAARIADAVHAQLARNC